MGIEERIYHDMMINGDDISIGSVEALKRIGIIIDEKSLRQYTNNWRKRHGMPMRRRT